jgi:hypothetical protein
MGDFRRKPVNEYKYKITLLLVYDGLLLDERVVDKTPFDYYDDDPGSLK